MKTLSPNKINSIMEVFKIYNESSSLEDAGQKLSLTRERVRQILKEGTDLGLINYKGKDSKLSYLIETYPRTKIIQSLITRKNKKQALESLNLNLKDAKKLFRHYEIKKTDYYEDKFRAKYLKQYSKIVVKFGRHPSTTELQASNQGRALYNAISRVWGSFQRFRDEFGIIKEKHFVTLQAEDKWKKAINKGRETRLKFKEEKKLKLLELIKEQGIVKRSQLAKQMGLSHSCIFNYLNELEQNGLIKLENKDNKVFYVPA